MRNREVPLPDTGELMLGRDSACDVVLDDRLASRRHAVLRCLADGIELVPERTLNGMRVNGEAVEGKRSLKHGDRLQIGSYVLLLVDGNGTHRGTSPTAPTARLRAAAHAPVPMGPTRSKGRGR